MYYNNFRNKHIEQNIKSPFFPLPYEVGNILSSIFDNNSNRTNEEESYIHPRIDIAENKTHYIVTTELPGVDQNSISLSFEKNTLTLSGEKKAEEHDKETTFYRKERSFGKFSRSIEFPEKANAEAIEANYQNGVLTIKIEKHKEAEAKKIEIRIS